MVGVEVERVHLSSYRLSGHAPTPSPFPPGFASLNFLRRHTKEITISPLRIVHFIRCMCVLCDGGA